jgi:hypothetical protein
MATGRRLFARRADRQAEHAPPPSTQNFAQWAWQSFTAPRSIMPP